MSAAGDNKRIKRERYHRWLHRRWKARADAAQARREKGRAT